MVIRLVLYFTMALGFSSFIGSAWLAMHIPAVAPIALLGPGAIATR